MTSFRDLIFFGFGILFMLAVQVASVNAEPPTKWSLDYAKGYCAGLNQMVTIVRLNRDHWRLLAGLPNESEHQVLARIYSKPRSGHLAPRTLDRPAGTSSPVSITDSVDLYVVPMHMRGRLYVGDPAHPQEIICDGPDDSGDLPQ